MRAELRPIEDGREGVPVSEHAFEVGLGKRLKAKRAAFQAFSSRAKIVAVIVFGPLAVADAFVLRKWIGV